MHLIPPALPFRLTETQTIVARNLLAMQPVSPPTCTTSWRETRSLRRNCKVALSENMSAPTRTLSLYTSRFSTIETKNSRIRPKRSCRILPDTSMAKTTSAAPWHSATRKLNCHVDTLIDTQFHCGYFFDETNVDLSIS